MRVDSRRVQRPKLSSTSYFTLVNWDPDVFSSLVRIAEGAANMAVSYFSKMITRGIKTRFKINISYNKVYMANG